MSLTLPASPRMVLPECCVMSCRYNVATFVPRFLFEQFSQVAYFYFLVQVRTLQSSLQSVAHSADSCSAEREPIASIAQRSGVQVPVALQLCRWVKHSALQHVLPYYRHTNHQGRRA